MSKKYVLALSIVGMVITGTTMAGNINAPEPEMLKPRDPNIAVIEEYQAAVSSNQKARLELFIARHPDHDLAKQAKEALTNAK